MATKKKTGKTKAATSKHMSSFFTRKLPRNNEWSSPAEHKFSYNIARALVLSKSYWAIMNKIFMYARPCSIKWRVQFHFSCKFSVEFSARSFCLSFGNVKIILSNPNPTSSLWLLPSKDVYLNVSILTLFASIFLEYFYFVWLRCFCECKS